MSDVSRGPGWWQASDDLWYPPEQHPDSRPPPPPGPPGAPTQPTPPRDPPSTPGRAAPPERRRTPGPGRRRVDRRVVLAVVVVLAAVVAYVVLSGGSGPRGASFAAVVTGTRAVDHQQLAVAVEIKNTGRSTGVATCAVHASSPDGTHTGAATLTSGTSLAPGQQRGYLVRLDISGDGADSVSLSGVSAQC